MPHLELIVLSLRYSSWSMRAWLTLTHAGAGFESRTVELESFQTTGLSERRKLGSISGLFPVLRVDGTPIHESLAIAEYAAEAFPNARLWPDATLCRAQARAICSEMVSNFSAMRTEMSCHLFGRVMEFTPSDAARKDIARVFEIWSECLERSGGPYLFGGASIADFFYYPVLTRLRTYSVSLPDPISAYAGTVDALPAVAALRTKARNEPAIEIYDDFLLKLGGDPNAD